MADHVVVMRAGIIEQQGSPLELYDRPANKFVAGFIGSPAMNFLPATAADNGALVLDSDSVRIGFNRDIAAGRQVWIGMRPEHLSLKPGVNDMTIGATVTGIESTGSMTFVVLAVASQPVVLAHAGRPEACKGDQVRLHIALDNLHFFDRETELAA